MFDGILEHVWKISREEQVLCMGWGLLLLWTLSITYMTRDFWFPSAFGLPPLSERVKVPVTIASPPRLRKKLSFTGKELRQLYVQRY